MAIQIIIDSASDMPIEEAVSNGITYLPMTVRFGDEEFYDRETLKVADFYNRLIESDEIPKTSQITPIRYQEAMEKALSEGKQVLCFTISSEVSGCYQSACMAADEIDRPDDIKIVDSKNFCVPYRLLVLYAVDLIKRGFSLDQIAEEMDRARDNVKVIALFETLEYLKLGGRLSAAAAAVGGLLGIKPVISITDGQVAVLGKARGSKKGNNMLVEIIKKDGINFDMPYCFAYTGLSDDLLKKYIEDSASIYEGVDNAYFDIIQAGPTIGTYAGPGAVAFSYFKGDFKPL